MIERRARLGLAGADEPMESAGGPTTYRPTGRRVLQRFENVFVSRVDGQRVLPENVDLPSRVGVESEFLGNIGVHPEAVQRLLRFLEDVDPENPGLAH